MKVRFHLNGGQELDVEVPQTDASKALIAVHDELIRAGGWKPFEQGRVWIHAGAVSAYECVIPKKAGRKTEPDNDNEGDPT